MLVKVRVAIAFQFWPVEPWLAESRLFLLLQKSSFLLLKSEFLPVEYVESRAFAGWSGWRQVFDSSIIVQSPLSINFPFFRRKSHENAMITPRNVTLSNGRVVARGSNAKWGAAAYVGGTWIRLGWELDWGQRSKNGPVHGNSMGFSKKEWSLPFGKIT